MRISSSEEGNVTVVHLSGVLDAESAPLLEEFANDLFAQGKMNVALDLGGCEGLSDEGLRSIVGIQKLVVNGGKLAFRNVGPAAMSAFDEAGYSDILTFE